MLGPPAQTKVFEQSNAMANSISSLRSSGRSFAFDDNFATKADKAIIKCMLQWHLVRRFTKVFKFSVVMDAIVLVGFSLQRSSMARGFHFVALTLTLTSSLCGHHHR